MQRAFNVLVVLLVLLLPLPGFAMNLRCASATAIAPAAASSHCHAPSPGYGSVPHHDCAPCCGGIIADVTLRLSRLQPVTLKIVSSSPGTPPHLARERLDRPPRLA